MLIAVLFISSCSFSQGRFSYGFKGGSGIWKMISLDGPHVGPPGPEYSYPIGYTIGGFIEYKFLSNMGIVMELYWQNNTFKQAISTGYEGYVEQELLTQFFRIPILIKYETPLILNTYFFLGPSLNFLNKADYKFKDIFYQTQGNEDIRSELPKISTAIEFGFGENIRVLDNFMLAEIRAQIGISKFENKPIDYPGIGKWRNFGMMFLIGYQID